MVLAGALPFGAVFIELFFILESLFENEFYYMFGTDLLLNSDVRPACPCSPSPRTSVRVNPKQDSFSWFSSLLSQQLPRFQLFSFIINFVTKVRPNVRPQGPDYCFRSLLDVEIIYIWRRHFIIRIWISYILSYRQA